MKKFTKIELEVLYFLIMGLTNREISEKLFISDNTIEEHLDSIFKKLKTDNKTRAIEKGIELCNGKYKNLKEFLEQGGYQV